VQQRGVFVSEGLIVFTRSIVAFFTLLIFARLLGKQQVSQLTFFEYILGISIGSIAASLSVDLTSRAWPHWVGLTTWTAIVFLFQYLRIKYKKFSQYLVGEPTVVIMDGKIMEDAMRKIRYTISELLEQLREKGVFNLNQVEFAVLETDGKLSVLVRPEYLPVTPRDMSLSVQSSGMAKQLIFNGIVLEENLISYNLDMAWLMDQLNKNGISSPAEVFLMARNNNGELYIDKYSDHIKRTAN
jgi:uncharacterized membrane protein YcaP (DUF421 family)